MASKAQNPFEADEYARLTGFDGKWRETWWRKDFLALITERVRVEDVERMLDVGCGVGHWGRILSQVMPSGVLISGIDIESKFVERSIELGDAYGLQSMDYRVGYAEAIPYDNNWFDLVTCQTVLIHVKDPASVLSEMIRVLKPGGTLILAEPNNLVGYLSLLLTEPRPEWSVVQELMDFYHTCLQGKRELGMGDSSIGDRLPGLVSGAGFCDVRVAINENCPTLIPPYAPEEQKIECEFLKSCLSSGAWLGFGPRDNAERLFKAGNGKSDKFDALWSQTMSVQDAIQTAIMNQTYSGGRGAMMYVITAKKPVRSCDQI
jgi:SAM-dependent methyltransferase